MNFLAHLYLSGDDDQLIIGNFIADMVKGRKINGYHPDVVRGIMLHRSIDTFTDNHLVVKQSKERLRQKYRLYAGVIVDMYYDHFLAKHWSDYSQIPLGAYVQKAYALLNRHKHMLPPRAQYILPFMTEQNWLESYADKNSLGRFFGGMSRRTPFPSGMEHAITDLEQHYDVFSNEFRAFFPDLIAFVETQGISHQHHR